MDPHGKILKGNKGKDKRESRRINVNLEAKLRMAGKTYPVLIGNLSETGLCIILPIANEFSPPLAVISDVEISIRVNADESIDLPCKKLWFADVPDSPLVKRIGFVLKSPPPAYKKFYKSLFFQERTEITRCPIAVIGLACYYPGSPDIQQLWENIVSRRRQFRRMPDVRLPLSDYYDPDLAAEDKTYGTKAAVIDGFSFDWIKRGIPKSVVDSTDISHWLALETALKAVEDAGFMLDKIPQDRTGVILGNSLTGEQSRAEGLRLRWPFVLKTLQTAAEDTGLPPELKEALAKNMEAYYKSVFTPVSEDTLAGGLSNTIAGRICNFLNINGGGYTVDGACSSSLLAVATAATALSNGNLDLAIVGGVDVSLDSFELIGFAKTRALTPDDMRVYDRRASGFIPGEGAGFVVLKRLDDARADGNYVYATLRGWGISTDGKGALTAPKAETQTLAIRRAYTGAGYGVNDIDFVEGHGTGTAVGDTSELTAIAKALGDRRNGSLRPCGITSLKSLIGHTKAASGIGGFLKAVMAVNRRVLPPTSNCSEPSKTFDNIAKLVYPIMHGEVRLPNDVLRAGISGMGFGGINCHVTVESGDTPSAKLTPSLEEKKLIVSSQETELFVLGAASPAKLLERVRSLHQIAVDMSIAEMVDLAAHLVRELDDNMPVRTAFMADSPESLTETLQELINILTQKPPIFGEKYINAKQNLFIGHSLKKNRVGFLFPGQGSQQLNMGRKLIERHDWARNLTDKAFTWLTETNGVDVIKYMFKPLDRAIDQNNIDAWLAALRETSIAQPAICLSSLLWTKKLERLGISPVAVGGHSLGELVAFHVAGAFDEEVLLKFAAVRGRAMNAVDGEGGIMASLSCSYDTVVSILSQVNGYVVAANINSPKQIVISGEKPAVEQAVALALQTGIDARMLRVSNAFHSKFVAGAALQLRSSAPVPLRLTDPKVKLFSGIGGRQMQAGLHLPDHFAGQITSQVDFVSVVNAMAGECDLLLEVGPSKVLSNLVRAITGDNGMLCLPVESKPGRDRDLHLCLAHLFVQGCEIHWKGLYEDRLCRPFVPASEKAFIVNPCERPLKRTASDKAKILSSNQLPVNTLASVTSIDPQVLTEYLQRRGSFLNAVINADIENISTNFQPLTEVEVTKNPVISLPTVSKKKMDSTPAVMIEEKAGNKENNISEIILGLVEKQTGFPRDSLSLELRLLDDLNLDSIKSAGLLADAALQLGISGEFDSVRYANASLAEIIDSLKQLTDVQTKIKTTTDILFDLIEKRTGFPRQSLSTEMRLLDDLNLDSIKSAELLADAAKRLNVAGDIDVSRYANKTVAEIAASFDLFLTTKEKSEAEKNNIPAKPILPSSWVRNFTIRFVEEKLSASETVRENRQNHGEKVLILCRNEELDLAEAIKVHYEKHGALSDVKEYGEPDQNFFHANYTTIIGIQPKAIDGSSTTRETILQGVKRLRIIAGLAYGNYPAVRPEKVVFVQFGGGYLGQHQITFGVEEYSVSAFAASLHLEQPSLKIRVLDFDSTTDHTRIGSIVSAELAASEHYRVAGYDSGLIRRIPRLALQQPADYTKRDISWSSDDVILVTGGAKGITSACALEFARQTGVRMALVGSSPHPRSENGKTRSIEIEQNLSSFEKNDLIAKYYQCDIVDRVAVEEMVKEVRRELGEITGVIHGSALNKPRTLDTVSTEEAFREISPKVVGAVNLCEILADKPPKLFVGFSSIIGVSGMERNGWYAFSNQTLDLLLRRFADKHPETSIQSIAFSIWDEIGMGVRLGSVSHLAHKGIAAIPVREGIARFLQLVFSDPGAAQVIVSARLANLDAILTSSYSLPQKARFLERILSYTPDVEVVARAHLDVKEDAYVQDHNWRGTLLFPTVFGLEAMAQAVAYVTGEDDFTSVRIENIRLERPIPVNPEKGTEIEIRAEVAECLAGDTGKKVHVSIGTEQSGYATPHFSATFVLGVKCECLVEKISIPTRPLDIDPGDHLYDGKLLFQGPRFQRLSQIYSLDSKHCIFTSRPTDQGNIHDKKGNSESRSLWLLDDPYFRDSLLHAVQLSVSQHICLPYTIEKIEKFSLTSSTNTPLTGIVQITAQTDKEVHAEVTVINGNGRIIERLSGYTLKILEYHKEYPLPEELANPAQRDEDIIRQQLQKISAEWQLILPGIAVASFPGLAGKTKEERHKLELPVFQRAIRQLQNGPQDSRQVANVSWLSSGKPYLDNAPDKGWDISLSHDHDTMLCIAGQGPQGCDLQSLSPRTREEWVALLGKNRELLLAELQTSGDSLDQAGTRIWAANEALYKAMGELHGNLVIKERKEENVIFSMTETDSEKSVLTFPVQFTKGSNNVVALVTRPAKHQQPSQLSTLVNHHARKLNFDLESYKVEITDAPHNQPAFTFSFPVTFKEAANPSRTLYYSKYFDWIGSLREYMIQPVYNELVPCFVNGKWGMVTNHAQTQIFGEASVGDVIEGRLWLDPAFNIDELSSELCFEWRKRLPDGDRQLIASSRMSSSWVAIRGHGIVKIQPFPGFWREFFRKLIPLAPSASAIDTTQTVHSSSVNIGPELHKEPEGPVKLIALLREEIFQTSQEDANFVGNVYFANYYKWQGRIRDNFLKEKLPEFYNDTGNKGELRCTECKINHLAEAMPFDRIAVRMYRDAVYEKGIRFCFDYYRLSPAGERFKLGHGVHEAIWYSPNAEGSWRPAKLPPALLGSLIPG